MAAAPCRVIRARPFLRPPRTRYKREGYLCPEWYHRARSTPVPCMGIQSTGSSTLLGQAVSFIPRPRMRRPRPEFLIIRRTFTKVSKPWSSTTPSRNILKTVEAARFPLFLQQRTLDRGRRRNYTSHNRLQIGVSLLPALFNKFGDILEKLSNVVLHLVAEIPTVRHLRYSVNVCRQLSVRCAVVAQPFYDIIMSTQRHIYRADSCR